ncbi:MAG: DUF883 C-terminal domain-containing protein [Beijerinckiaceae bacterium]
MAKASTDYRNGDDEPNGGRRAKASREDSAPTFTDTLKEFGIDTDIMTESAKERAVDMQQTVIDELKERPLRTLGAAAAIGMLFGYLASR